MGTLLIAAVVAGSVFALRKIGYLEGAWLSALVSQRRRNLTLRAGMLRVYAQLRRASHPDEVWSAVKLAARHLGASFVALHVAERCSSGPEHFQWRDRVVAPGGVLAMARYSLRVERPGGVLELGWEGTPSGADRDVDTLVERMCLHVQAALQRMSRPEAAVSHAPREGNSAEEEESARLVGLARKIM